MKETVNRFEEEIITTSNLSEMKNKYLAETLYRKWPENFVDESTGELVNIERKEIIFARGTLLDSNALEEINFFLQSGDITEVRVSNIKRQAILVKGSAATWVAVAKLMGKKQTFYLYADSVDTAMQVLTDYIEQHYQGSFEVLSVKEQEYLYIVSLVNGDMSEEKVNYYIAEMEIKTDGYTMYNKFLVKAINAEETKPLCIAFFDRFTKNKGQAEPYTMTLLSAKKMKVEAVIDHVFCNEYIDRSKGKGEQTADNY